MSTGAHAPASSWGVFETWADDDRLRQVDLAPCDGDGLTDHRVGVLKTLDGRRCWCSPCVDLRNGVVLVGHADVARDAQGAG